jgi:hypothetical protein
MCGEGGARESRREREGVVGSVVVVVESRIRRWRGSERRTGADERGKQGRQGQAGKECRARQASGRVGRKVARWLWGSEGIRGMNIYGGLYGR